MVLGRPLFGTPGSVLEKKVNHSPSSELAQLSSLPPVIRAEQPFFAENCRFLEIEMLDFPLDLFLQ